jgi:hypothetical protein
MIDLDPIAKVQAFQSAASKSSDAELRIAYLALARDALSQLEARAGRLALLQTELEKATPALSPAKDVSK